MVCSLMNIARLKSDLLDLKIYILKMVSISMDTTSVKSDLLDIKIYILSV